MAACLSEIGIPSEAFEEVLHVWYLEELAEHQGQKSYSGLYYTGLPGPLQPRD